MEFQPPANLACPLDGGALQKENSRFVCANGHSFDVARQGYLNLLPVQHKKSKSPGDSKAMVEARTRFLATGVYQPIARRLCEILRGHWPESSPVCLLDAGCGEGYYLDYLYDNLFESPLRADFIGMDISKPAIVAAVKRNRRITWLVAGNRQPPLLPASVDIILCMFGFPVYDAFMKILKPGGKLVLVEAGTHHLIELRRVIYEQVRQRLLPSLDAARHCGFELLEQDSITYQTDPLSQPQISDLLLMTPHLFRANAAGKQRAAQLERIALTVDVSFRVLYFGSSTAGNESL
jgi:23S rRNA (guanine745-N1)-methyltransferase